METINLIWQIGITVLVVALIIAVAYIFNVLHNVQKQLKILRELKEINHFDKLKKQISELDEKLISVSAKSKTNDLLIMRNTKQFDKHIKELNEHNKKINLILDYFNLEETTEPEKTYLKRKDEK